MVDKSTLKGLAHSETSFEDFERFKENKLYSSRNLLMEDSCEMNDTERRAQHDMRHNGVWKTEKVSRPRGKDEQNSDKDDDIRSS